MAGTIKAVVFDMGGVLLRSENYAPRIALAKKYGLTLKQLEDLVFNSESAALATVGKLTDLEHWAQVCNSLNVPYEDRGIFEEDFWKGDRLDKELIDFLDSLRPGIKTGLLSNAWVGTREILKNRHACRDVFDVSIFSYEVGLAKPDPEIYRLILEYLKVDSCETIFLDDNQENVESANVLGFHAILFTDREQALKEIRALL